MSISPSFKIAAAIPEFSRTFGEFAPPIREFVAVFVDGIRSDSAHPHAATSLSNGNSYQYDLNGNQTRRTIGTDTYLLAYDAENRLVKVCKDTSSNGVCETSEEVARFFYDADGKRVKSLLGSETTLFIGGHYEITNPGSGQTISKYYFAGAQRLATLAPHASAGVRKYVIPSSMTVEYLLGDHLGSRRSVPVTLPVTLPGA